MLPNLVVIGAQKAGTSSLHFYLGLHPEISMSAVKELNYFSGPGWNWDRGLEWYMGHFTEDAPVRGESSPSYAAYPYTSGAPERMHALVPDAKLIYMVRDPVQRMISAYVHRRARGNEQRSMAEVFSDPNLGGTGYLAQSLYHAQLERYLEHFDPDQVLVVDQEDLLRRRSATLSRIFGFLEVEEDFSSPRFGSLRNTTVSKLPGTRIGRRAHRLLERSGIPGRARLGLALARAAPRPRLDEGLRRSIVDRFFADDVARLREQTGQRFESWSV